MRFPWSIYSEDSPWVPPLLSELDEQLDPERHPFFEHAEMQLFVARRDGEMVGRIAAIVNRAHLDLYDDGVGFFGYFEAIDDPEAAKALFSAAEGWLSERGMKVMRGPMNPSVNDEVGLLLDSFDQRPVLLMPYNPAYYLGLYQTAGLAKVRNLYAYIARRDNGPSEKHIRLAEALKRRYRIEVRNARVKDAEKEAGIFERIYREAWEEQWGAVPMTPAEAVFLTKKLKQMADERMVVVASIDGEPAAFGLAVPDWNHFLKQANGKIGPIDAIKYLFYRLRPDSLRGLRLMALGVVKEHRRKGLEALMILEIARRALASSYEFMEISWVLEDNVAANNVLANLGTPRYRSYGLFEKQIV